MSPLTRVLQGLGLALLLFVPLLHVLTWLWMLAGGAPGWGPLALTALGIERVLRREAPANTAGIRGAVLASLSLVIFVTVLACIRIPDLGYDSLAYHMPAQVYLSEGWNPYRRVACCPGGQDCASTRVLIEHYPKAAWITGACFVVVTGRIDSAKALNVLLLLAAYAAAIAFVRLPGRATGAARVATVALLVWNPTALNQLVVAQVDSPMASALTCMILAVLVTRRRPSPGLFLAAALHALFASCLKFTGLPFVGVLLAGLLGHELANREPRARWRAVVMGAALLGAVLGPGANPWLVNLVMHQNPVYPAYDHRSGRTVLDEMATPEFLARGRVEKFLLSQFATAKAGAPTEPRYGLPFHLRLDLTPGVGPRFGGHGPFYGEALILALPLLLTLGVSVHRVLGLALLVTLFATGAGWWARLVPQAWWLPVLGAWDGLQDTDRRWRRGLAWVVALLLLVSTGFATIPLWIFTALHTPPPVPAPYAARSVHPEFDHFVPYARRILEELRGDGLPLEPCDPEHRIPLGFPRGVSLCSDQEPTTAAAFLGEPRGPDELLLVAASPEAMARAPAPLARILDLLAPHAGSLPAGQGRVWALGGGAGPRVAAGAPRDRPGLEVPLPGSGPHRARVALEERPGHEVRASLQVAGREHGRPGGDLWCLRVRAGRLSTVVFSAADAFSGTCVPWSMPLDEAPR